MSGLMMITNFIPEQFNWDNNMLHNYTNWVGSNCVDSLLTDICNYCDNLKLKSDDIEILKKISNNYNYQFIFNLNSDKGQTNRALYVVIKSDDVGIDYSLDILSKYKNKYTMNKKCLPTCSHCL